MFMPIFSFLSLIINAALAVVSACIESVLFFIFLAFSFVFLMILFSKLSMGYYAGRISKTFLLTAMGTAVAIVSAIAYISFNFVHILLVSLCTLFYVYKKSRVRIFSI